MNKELNLNELEAVSGGGFFDNIINVINDMRETVIEAPNRIIDLIEDLF